MATNVGVLGLGIMGGAFAANLVEAGFAVHGYDPDPDALANFADRGGSAGGSPADVVSRCDIAVLSLPSPAALHAVVDSITAADVGAAVLLECSTLALADKQRAHDALAAHGVTLLDCPISGTGSQAAAKQLVVFGSGDEAAYQRAREVISSFANAERYIGPFGHGSKLKFVANTLVAIHTAGAAEALVLAAKAGLDLSLVHEVISGSPATSTMFNLRGKLMTERNYRPALMKPGLWQKDMTIIGQFAEELGLPAPLFSASAPLFAKLLEGREEDDTAAVYEVLADQVGLDPT